MQQRIRVVTIFVAVSQIAGWQVINGIALQIPMFALELMV